MFQAINTRTKFILKNQPPFSAPFKFDQVTLLVLATRKIVCVKNNNFPILAPKVLCFILNAYKFCVRWYACKLTENNVILSAIHILARRLQQQHFHTLQYSFFVLCLFLFLFLFLFVFLPFTSFLFCGFFFCICVCVFLFLFRF